MLKIIKSLKQSVIFIVITILADIASPAILLFAIIVFSLKSIIKNLDQITEEKK